MFQKIFSSLKAGNNNEPANVRRSHTRREGDHCVTMIDGKIYPVQNWSLGGLQISGDDRFFAMNDEMAMTLKFKLGNSVKDVSHMARVVRKNNGRISFQFAPLTRKTRIDFQNVVNDYMTSQFVASYSA